MLKYYSEWFWQKNVFLNSFPIAFFNKESTVIVSVVSAFGPECSLSIVCPSPVTCIETPSTGYIFKGFLLF